MKSVLKWLYLKTWKEPKDIRGVGWTILFWLTLLNGIVCSSYLCRTREGAIALLGFFACSAWLDHLNSKPKRLGRELPYRRRR
ncbi:MAG: hypothetical protein HOP12_02330 [Candidatus Eisenbacteria bacterium]|uniref:Uncharacterized protein n=1 Tax=Eiseniibacteriota bacterium TaxID=2212470 RepID=A0A849SJF5_UNCEI|nr:hypothetical protein [Candidatus Eisenbacteria bacterium]